jgi:hypothetical protein
MSELTWQVRVTGHVPTEELLEEIGEVVVAEHESRTVLSARFPDQAALHGFLQRLRAHGFEVVDVRSLPSGER